MVRRLLQHSWIFRVCSYKIHYTKTTNCIIDQHLFKYNIALLASGDDGLNILVTGACGYKGSVLVPKLLDAGYHVIAFDTQWFGQKLPSHANMELVKGDVRSPETIPIDGVDCVIHLASIANDPCGDLNPKLTWEVSALATMQLADLAKRHGVKRFIYASSGSVYGLKDEEHVTENLSLEPISEYNKTKMVAERVLLSYATDMTVQIIRPATVCGVSPRMRLDVAVNLLTVQALANGKMTVFGGDQIRPNIHIDDITDVYIHMLENPQCDGIFNAGFENASILDIANKISAKIDSKIIVTESNDPRSYRVNSDKLLATGFKPRKTFDHAITEIIQQYRTGRIKDEDINYNLRWMEKMSFSKDNSNG